MAGLDRQCAANRPRSVLVRPAQAYSITTRVALAGLRLASAGARLLLNVDCAALILYAPGDTVAVCEHGERTSSSTAKASISKDLAVARTKGITPGAPMFVGLGGDVDGAAWRPRCSAGGEITCLTGVGGMVWATT